MKAFSSIISFGLICSGTLTAQQLPLGSAYFLNPMVVNPAYVGHTETTNIFMTHRSQFTGIAGSPQTTYLTIDAPTRMNNVGLGLYAYSDVTSILSRNGVSGNYSYSVKLGDEHKLTFGAAGGVVDNSINFQQAVARDMNDPYIFEQRVHRTVVDAGAGLLYTWKGLEAGASVAQFFGNTTFFKINDGSKYSYDLDRHYVGSLKYTFLAGKSEGVAIYPMLLTRATKGAPVQYDVNLVADWKKWGWAAVTYRSNYAVGVSLGFRYHQLSMGYAHDFCVSRVRSYVGQTHELLVSYHFGNDVRKRLDQHDKELEELRQRTGQNEEDIESINEQLDEVREQQLLLQDSVRQLKAAMDELRKKAEERPQPQVQPDESAVGEAGKPNFRTHHTADFVDENGNPMPTGYYVVIGSFGVKDNAIRFRNERQGAGSPSATIVYHKAIKIYNVFVLHTDDYETAHAERIRQTPAYANTWVLKLE